MASNLSRMSIPHLATLLAVNIMVIGGVVVVCVSHLYMAGVYTHYDCVV